MVNMGPGCGQSLAFEVFQFESLQLRVLLFLRSHHLRVVPGIAMRFRVAAESNCF